MAKKVPARTTRATAMQTRSSFLDSATKSAASSLEVYITIESHHSPAARWTATCSATRLPSWTRKSKAIPCSMLVASLAARHIFPSRSLMRHDVSMRLGRPRGKSGKALAKSLIRAR
eukprot:s1447_g20.t1